MPEAPARQWHKMYPSKLRLVHADRNRPFQKVFTASRPVGGRCTRMYHRFSYEMPHLVHSGTKPVFLYTPRTAWTLSVSAELARGSRLRPLCSDHRRRPPSSSGVPVRGCAQAACGGRGRRLRGRPARIPAFKLDAITSANPTGILSTFVAATVQCRPTRPPATCPLPKLRLSCRGGRSTGIKLLTPM